MRQRYTVVLWKKAGESTTEEDAKIIYNLIQCLKQYYPDLTQMYLPAWSKNKAKLFDTTLNSIEKLVAKKRTNNTKYAHLGVGYTIGMFSSFDFEDCVSLRCSLSATNPTLTNSVTIDLPPMFFEKYFRQEIFQDFFCKLVDIVQPYYAFVLNSMNDQLAQTYWKNAPTFVHWMNYYSLDTQGLIRINKIDDVWEKKTEHGTFLTLFPEPLDINNKKHLLKQKEVSVKICGV